MLEQIIRSSYQRYFVDGIAKHLPQKIHPTQITLIGACLGLGVIPALVWQQPLYAVFILLISGYCDTLDGTIARMRCLSSALGSALDIVSDRIVESAVILGLFLVNPNQRGLICLIMLISILICVTSFLVVGIFTPNQSEKSFHYSNGLIERAEAFLFFILMILMPHYFEILAYVFSFLTFVTALIRMYEFYRASKNSLG